MKPLFFLLVCFFWIGGITHVDAQKLEIDLRTDTSNKKYFVGLAIRNDSFTGHAFVILYQQDQQDTEKKDFKVYGYYPKRIANVPIPIGVVKNDIYECYPLWTALVKSLVLCCEPDKGQYYCNV
jgi:hypothetical protein